MKTKNHFKDINVIKNKINNVYINKDNFTNYLCLFYKWKNFTHKDIHPIDILVFNFFDMCEDSSQLSELVANIVINSLNWDKLDVLSSLEKRHTLIDYAFSNIDVVKAHYCFYSGGQEFHDRLTLNIDSVIDRIYFTIKNRLLRVINCKGN